MSYLVFCTFDLKNASSTDYQTAYDELSKLGLDRVHSSNGNNVVIPTTSTMGFFNGQNASDVCTDVRTNVQAAFKARRFKSEIFIITGGDWAWVPTTT
jgi:hypothetical protein